MMCPIVSIAAGSPAAAADANANTMGDGSVSDVGDMASLFSSSIHSVLGVDEWPCVYSGNFQQKRSLTGTNATLTSTGQFLYSCEQGLLWETHKPIVESVVYTQADRQFRVRSGGRVKALSGVVQSRVGKLLLSLLGGNSVELTKDFTAQVDAVDANLITLAPNKPSLQQHIKSISLHSATGKMTVGIKTVASGDTTMQIDQFVVQNQIPVVACASISRYADQACRLLFDTATTDE